MLPGDMSLDRLAVGLDIVWNGRTRDAPPRAMPPPFTANDAAAGAACRHSVIGAGPICKNLGIASWQPGESRARRVDVIVVGDSPRGNQPLVKVNLKVSLRCSGTRPLHAARKEKCI